MDTGSAFQIFANIRPAEVNTLLFYCNKKKLQDFQFVTWNFILHSEYFLNMVSLILFFGSGDTLADFF